LLFPPAGAAIACVRELAMGTRVAPASGRMRFVRPIACALIPAIALLLVWPGVRHLGARLRERHRWAAHVCRVADQPRICQWRRAPSGPADSPVLGVWDGVGLSIEPGAAADTVVVLPPGRYRVSAALDVAPTTVVPPPGNATLSASGAARFTVPLLALDQQSRAGETEPASFELAHAGGPLTLRLAVAVDAARAARVWLSNLRIEAVREAP
jgi:hypothetical protein